MKTIHTKWFLSAVALQLAVLPAQLNAFRAPAENENTLPTLSKKKQEYQTLQLTKVSKNHLKYKLGTSSSFAVNDLAQAIFNHGIDQALKGNFTNGTSASIASIRKEQTDKLGFRHIRTAQKYKNIPVIGAELVIHINNKGTVYMINGAYQPDTDIDTVPKISATDALAVALSEWKQTRDIEIDKQPALVIYNGKLAWFYTVKLKNGKPNNWYYYIDAHNGKVINRYNRIMYNAPVEEHGSAADITGNRLEGEDNSTVTINGFKENSSGSNNYFLYSFENKWGIFDTDTNDWEQNASSSWGTVDQAAISCAKNLADTQAYVSTMLNRDSFDDNGSFARADIHVGDNYVNAYWDGSKFNFGDGDGSTASALTVLDVTAHEYGHAITQYTSNLEYHDESGALNEAYSDIIGTAVEFHVQSDGTGAYPNAQAGKSDWLMGEDCWLSDTALRDMKDPQRYNQPSYYHGTYWYDGTNDYGGVHTNSGVVNFAFYLLATGGEGSNDGHNYNITGIGIEHAAEVALRANYFYHTSTTSYHDAKNDWIQAAEDLGYDSQTVKEAWEACGVLEPTPPLYSINDSAAYAFIDISESGTNLELSDDQSKNITIPFTFKFYDQNYTAVNINSNGTLSFTSTSNVYTNNEIPTSSFPDLIAAMWDDLNPATGGAVYWEVQGEAPNRKLIVQWNNVPHYSNSDSGVTFEVVLREGSEDILVQYKDVDFGVDEYNFGASATVGIQRDSTKGLPYSYNSAVLRNESAILFKRKRMIMEPIFYLLF